MSLLTVVEPDQAEGEIAAIYAGTLEAIGVIPNAMKMQSVNPMALREMAANIGYVMNHPSLSPVLFTLIRLGVSTDHSCAYCVTTNKGILLEAGMSMEQIDAIQADPSQAPLSEKEKALLLYTLKAVGASNEVGAQEIAALRELGASDLEIFDALAHGANQLAGDVMINALKVENDF
ncbi:MAG: carboxymuconolactone decarboxylase family protein [Thiolinea sp.]